MCLILIVWRANPRYPCVIAANRDELHERAAATAAWWADRPQILAGRDLSAGGTWLGVTRSGRFAALTNYRDTTARRVDAPSRGVLVADFLASGRSLQEQLLHLAEVSAAYSPFNLMFSDGKQLGVFESTAGTGRELGPGIYGLSNHLLDTPWPKVQNAKSKLRAVLSESDDSAAILEILRDAVVAPDSELPRTGISVEWERLLSSAFILSPAYGTRCSTVIRIDRLGTASFDEWSWDSAGSQNARVHQQFQLSSA